MCYDSTTLHLGTSGGFYTQRLVTMYNVTGDSWELPALHTGRWSHGCSWYEKGEDTVRVWMVLLYMSTICTNMCRYLL